MTEFDIVSFALPNCAPGEVRFEEPRDISKIVIVFKRRSPDKIGLSYLNKMWPKVRLENLPDLDNAFSFGWTSMDDWFNVKWRKSEIEVYRASNNSVAITFKGLTTEFPEIKDYNVKFRRTLGIRVDVKDKYMIKKIAVYTTSIPSRTTLRVKLDASRRTAGKKIGFYGYNAVVENLSGVKGVSVKKGYFQLRNISERIFKIAVKHMIPAHRYSNDDGHITFVINDDRITISIASLDRKGPIWFSEKGIYITKDEDKISFSDYITKIKKDNTISQMVCEKQEQSFAGAYYGQPRPHAVSYNLGCKYARQRFWLESNGDIFLHKWNIETIKGKDTARFKNKGSGRFFFGLEHWSVISRFNDPAPALVYNIHMRRDNIILEQKSFAVPLLHVIGKDELAGDDTIVAIVRFRFKNLGDTPDRAELSINYSQDSQKSYNAFSNAKQNDNLVPKSKFEKLSSRGNQILGNWDGQKVLRCSCKSTMKPVQHGERLLFVQKLEPDETCEIILKIPFITIESKEELTSLDNLDFDKCYSEATRFWRTEGKRGAQLKTSEPHLNALYKAHLSHVLITDFAMPDGSGLINTSVGTSTYGNYSNESCMIIQELDQRGLHEEARRRLSVWIKYQGTASQPGNFIDYEGMYYGAGGFECGNYNQHHGWVLWCLCEHYFLTRDDEWLASITDSIIKGADWVFRQRKTTMTQLPYSRDWEYGFFPAGSLEDVTEFYYWLSTNVLTWRGVEWTARALETIKHPEAGRIRKESDAYRKDLIKGFETMRQHSPLVRLRNGHWVPHYPSRLYCRGRDVGWIREVHEGSIYLLISGFYDSHSKQAQWILDDFQDNRYVKPPYGYLIEDFQSNWFDRGGFSMQPNLLAGLMSYLIRDEVEIYIWMFFNAWCACYREEIDAMVEHPAPVLGYYNSAHFKTSDQANAVMWLRYMYVFTSGGLLHFGRAIPREWLKNGNVTEATGVITCFGSAGIKLFSQASEGKIIAKVNLSLNRNPDKILVRFRHPEKLKIKSARVNEKEYTKYEPMKGDVDITGHNGEVVIEVNY